MNSAFFLGLFILLAVGAWSSSRRKQREMELRYELYGRMLEHPGPEAERIHALLEREAEKRKEAAQGSQTAGALITLSVGIALGIFLYFVVPRFGPDSRPVYLIALAPILVGLVMLVGALRGPRKK